jgi:predicted dehydrogenase
MASQYESPTIKMALVGGGMFGRDVVLRSMADVQRFGIAPYLGTTGLDHRANDLAGVRFETVAVGTRTEASADALVRDYRQWVPDAQIKPFSGEAPWRDILSATRPDVLFVATPDHLHTAPIYAALEQGVHVVAEKPLALSLDEAITIRDTAAKSGLVVAVDMHKRYDSFLRSAFVDIAPQLGDLLYGRAVLEEPLEVSTQIFKWAADSNPFSYVGVHWTDLFGYYLGIKPVSLHAVGQKKLLVNWHDDSHPNGIDTFDSMQVTVQYDNGMSVQYVNAWINPADFEGPVNQEMEIVGAKGRVFVDQQDRGMRSCITGNGSRTHNPHFQAEVPRSGGPEGRSSIGYCKDSLIAGLEAAASVKLGQATAAERAGTYPDAASAIPCVAILEAANEVARANHAYLAAGQGASVSARFAGDAYGLVDPATGAI